MVDRAAVRVVPRNAVTVAIETQGLPLAHGVVANISDGGACVWTNGAFQVGENLVLRLSFPREPLPLQAAGRVVWEETGRESRSGALRYGLQWSHSSGPQHQRLRLLIADSAS
jgi:Tfp pilus assembly protein PilZ